MKYTNKSLLALCLGLLSSSALFADAAKSASLYETIAEYHLPIMAKTAELEKAEAAKLSAVNQEAAKKKKPVTVVSLGKAEKVKMLYDVFAMHEDVMPAAPINLHPQAIKDMEFYAQEGELLNKLAPTLTDSGKICFQRMVFQATTDIGVIKNRQAFIQSLLKDPALMRSLQDTLREINTAETEMIWFWKDVEKEVTEYLAKVLWKKGGLKDLNENSAIMTVTAGMNMTDVALLWMSFPAFSVLGAKLIQKIFISDLKRGKLADEIYTNYKYWALPGFATADSYGITKAEWDGGPASGKALLYGLNVLQSAWFYWQIYKAVVACMEHHKIMSLIEQKMTYVQSIISNVQKMNVLIAQTSVGAGFAQELRPMQLSSQHLGQKTEKFLAAAKALDPEAKAFFTKGNAMTAYALMDHAKGDLIGQLKIAGTIDALVAVAQVVKDHAGKTGQYCFVDHVQQATPYIALEGYWHPALDPDEVITNDIIIGGSNPANVMITGPNAGGKSTSLKAITLAVLLGQSFGVAPARSATLTPFSMVNTYLNIADTTGKESLFQAEMRRTGQLLHDIRALKPKQLSFVILDEIFTGTNPREGMAGAYGVAKKLTSYPNSMAIIATHFKEITALEQETGKYTNYKVAIDRVDGRIVYQYKLLPGVTDQAIALDLLAQEGFDADILASAQSLMQR